MPTPFESVDDYYASFPEGVRAVLAEVRTTIIGVVPEAEEKMSYGIASFVVGGRAVVYLAGWNKHISIYPVPALSEPLDSEIAPYRAGRGTLKFLLNRPVPLELVEEIVRHLLEQRRK